MNIGNYTQEHIQGETEVSDAEAIIQTNGRQIRPLMSMMTCLVDECKLHLTDDGIWTLHTDPANVGMAHIQARPPAFDGYEFHGDDTLVGVHVKGVKKAVQDARKPHKDPVELRFNDRRTLVSLQREYPTGTLEWSDRMMNLDPDSIRQEPDPLSDKALDNHLEWEATIGTDALRDAVMHVKESVADHLTFREADGHLLALAHRTDTEGPLTSDEDKSWGKAAETVVDFGEVAESTVNGGTEGADSIFSLDYLVSLAKALKNGDIYEVTLQWGEQYPCVLAFDRTDDDDRTMVEGAFYLAPRIQDD